MRSLPGLKLSNAYCRSQTTHGGIHTVDAVGIHTLRVLRKLILEDLCTSHNIQEGRGQNSICLQQTQYGPITILQNSVHKQFPIYTSSKHRPTFLSMWRHVSFHLMTIQLSSLILALFWSPLTPEGNVLLFSC